jgi:hypothetical protein
LFYFNKNTPDFQQQWRFFYFSYHRRNPKNYTNQFNTHLKKVNGQTALMPLKAGLIDHAATRDQVRDHLIKLVGVYKKTTPIIALGIRLPGSAGQRSMGR